MRFVNTLAMAYFFGPPCIMNADTCAVDRRRDDNAAVDRVAVRSSGCQAVSLAVSGGHYMVDRTRLNGVDPHYVGVPAGVGRGLALQTGVTV